MGIGAMITSGKDNKRLPDALMDKVAEVRVEQHLDEPTTFAILFAEEYGESGPVIQDAPELVLGELITIVSECGGDLTVLVHGPITKVKAEAKLGGPGSGFTVYGGDRRIEMEREEKQACYTGTATTAMNRVLGTYGMLPQVALTTRLYTEFTENLVQRGSDYDFVQDLAEQNNFCFWIECSAIEIPGPSPRLLLTEKAMVRPSPDRPLGGAAAKLLGGAGNALGKAADAIGNLVGGGGVVKLRVHPSDPTKRSVTGFTVEADGERATEAKVFHMNKGSLDAKDDSAEDLQPPLMRGRTSKDVTSCRKLLVTGAGDKEDLQNVAQSILTDEGWFVHASCSTSVNLLGSILCPHQIVYVDNMGSTHSGEYQVEDVTHVINASHHMMDINLRRNVLGEPDTLPI